MRRRDFLEFFGGAATAWPLTAHAQQPATPVVGYLHSSTTGASANGVAAFRQGLSEAGYVEDRNVAVEFRFAEGRLDRLPELAAELVRRQVAVIVAAGSPGAALAAKRATSTIPIAFAMADDPVKYGVVASLNRPGGNITGVNFPTGEVGGKRLDLLLELVPHATTIAYLSGPSRSAVFADLTTDMLAAAQALKRQIIVLEALRDLDFEAIFANLVQRRAEALVVGSYVTFLEPRILDEIVGLAARHKIPAIYPNRQYVDRGGLMSYGADAFGAYRQLGAFYVGQILRGAKPADLPVQRTTRYVSAINLKTARSLGIQVPRILLAIADELIE